MSLVLPLLASCNSGLALEEEWSPEPTDLRCGREVAGAEAHGHSHWRLV